MRNPLSRRYCVIGVCFRYKLNVFVHLAPIRQCWTGTLEVGLAISARLGSVGSAEYKSQHMRLTNVELQLHTGIVRILAANGRFCSGTSALYSIRSHNFEFY